MKKIKETKNVIDIYVDGSKTIYEFSPFMSNVIAIGIFILIFYLGYYFGVTKN